MRYIIGYIIDMFMGYFRKQKEENTAATECKLPQRQYKSFTMDELIDKLDYPNIPDVKVEVSDKPTLLIVDDIIDTGFILQATCKEINRRHHVDFYKDFNVIFVTTESCGLSTLKLIMKTDVKIDYAIIDLSIGTRVNIPNADILEMNGIDLAKYVVNKFPDIKFKFFTAHTLSRDDKRMKIYYNTCKLKFGQDLEDMTISKSDERTEGIYNFLYK